MPIVRGIAARENMLGGIIAAWGFFCKRFALAVVAVPEIE